MMEMATALSSQQGGFIQDINVTGPDGNTIAAIDFNGPVGNVVAGVLVGQKISAAIKIQALFRGYATKRVFEAIKKFRPDKVMVRLRSEYEGAGKDLYFIDTNQ